MLLIRPIHYISVDPTVTPHPINQIIFYVINIKSKPSNFLFDIFLNTLSHTLHLDCSRFARHCHRQLFNISVINISKGAGMAAPKLACHPPRPPSSPTRTLCDIKPLRRYTEERKLTSQRIFCRRLAVEHLIFTVAAKTTTAATILLSDTRPTDCPPVRTSSIDPMYNSTRIQNSGSRVLLTRTVCRPLILQQCVPFAGICGLRYLHSHTTTTPANVQ